MADAAPGEQDCRVPSGGALSGSGLYCSIVRAGFVARGVTYGVIGGLAAALALGAGTDGTAPNQQGALALIAQGGLGRVAVFAMAAGLLAYAVWKFDNGLHGGGPEGGGGGSVKDRVSSFAGGACYLVFFGVAVEALIGSGANSSGTPRQAAAGVLGWPGGPVLVGLAGLILILVSILQAYEALQCRFADECRTADMSPVAHRAFLRLGQVGLVARAAVFVLVGYFLLRTAIGYNAHEAVGLDGALERLQHQDFGPLMVGVAAAGLLTFAVFSFVEARCRRL
jgi:hypothetical protein